MLGVSRRFCLLCNLLTGNWGQISSPFVFNRHKVEIPAIGHIKLSYFKHTGLISTFNSTINIIRHVAYLTN